MSPISFDDASSTWLLETPSTCYGIAVEARRGVPRHLHWGRPLGHDALAELSAGGDAILHGDRVAWADESPVEFVPWGGRRFDEPSLKLDFADGTRVTEWRFGGQEVHAEDGSTVLSLTLEDVAYPLSLELCYRVFEDSDVIERWARLVNNAEVDVVVVRQAHSASWWLPERSSWRLTSLHGGWGSETQLKRRLVEAGKVVLESRRGTTSHQELPLFALDPCGVASEEQGEVWSGQLAWSGSWKLICERTPGGHLHVSAGWNDFDSPLEVAAGSELVFPVFAGLYSNGGFGAMSRAWHEYELRHVLSSSSPRVGGSPSFPSASEAGRGGRLPDLRPVLYNSWEATTFAVDELGQLQLAELAAEMGIELFVIDDGWFSGRDSDRAGLGDWTVDTRKFPRGLTPVIERVRELGMGFGIWVEPEMVNPDSELYRAHPEWVYHFPNRARSLQRNQLVLNMARDDVAAWVYDSLDRLLTEDRIDFVKWDMNRHFSEPGWPSEVGHNPERSWVDHTRNLYRVLDRLKASHPEVAFESCSGGGGRIDLGILSRTQQVWPSDNTDAWDRIAIQEGFSVAHAALAMVNWVTDSPNPLTGRCLPLSYRFHVAMAGALGVGGNLTHWPREELDEARELVALYKSIRHVVQHGRLYRLASTLDGPIGGVEYVSRDDQQVVVLAWVGSRRYGVWPARLRLAGVDRAARYQDEVSGAVHAGSVLIDYGIELPDGQDFVSRLVQLRRLDREG